MAEENENLSKRKKSGSHLVTIVMGLLTIVATIIAAVPAFRQYSQDRPAVYYNTENVSILNQVQNFERVKAILQQNRIPDSWAIVKLINVGDGAAKRVKMQIRVPGVILETSTDPSLDANPIWVAMPKQLDDFKGKASATIEFSDLGTSKVLEVSIGYDSIDDRSAKAESEVFFDSKPAEYVRDIYAAPTNSLFATLKVPLIILGLGVVLTLLVAAAIVLVENEELALAVARFVLKTAKLSFPFMTP